MGEFKIKNKNEILNNILINILEKSESVTDANVGSVIRTLVEGVGLEQADLYNELNAIYLGTRIDTATKSDLENLGMLLGISRKEGTKSQGYVSFIRRTPATSDFIIPANSIISTQPNVAETQLRYLVKNNTTFNFSIQNEEHRFLNGVYDFSLKERFMENIQSLDGTVNGSPRVFLLNTDYQIMKNVSRLVINPNTVELIDNCDATTNWIASAGATAIEIDNLDKKQGTSSLKLGKSTITSDTVFYNKTLGSIIDATGKNNFLWLKIADTSTLNKINHIKITIGSGGSMVNSYSLKFYQTNLKTGWNMIKTDFAIAGIEKLGFPNKVAFNYIKITIVTNNTIDLISSGDIKMDYWIFGQSEDYIGDIISFLQTGTLPDDNTKFYVDYKPLSKEVLCESERVGSNYNIGKLKLIFKVSHIPNIDSVNNYKVQTGGTNIEEDEDLRDRIKHATELKGKATVEALRQAVLGVEGVTSVSIDDMPFRTMAGETHNHISFISTPTQKLDNEVAQNDSYFTITGIRSGIPVTFINGTDYYLQDSTIFWIDDLKNPDNGTNISVNYNYRWLGQVRLFIAGTATPLATEIINNVNKAIYDTRAAGINVEWAEPIIIIIDVSANILVNTALGYTFANLSETVRNAIETFLNNKDTGEDVYISELTEVIMNVDGVLNCVVTHPTSDIAIAVNEVARGGSINIGSL